MCSLDLYHSSLAHDKSSSASSQSKNVLVTDSSSQALDQLQIKLY